MIDKTSVNLCDHSRPYHTSSGWYCPDCGKIITGPFDFAVGVTSFAGPQEGEPRRDAS